LCQPGKRACFDVGLQGCGDPLGADRGDRPSGERLAGFGGAVAVDGAEQREVPSPGCRLGAVVDGLGSGGDLAVGG